MPEYRYIGVNVGGQPIQGVVYCPDDKTVKAKINELVQMKGIRIDTVQKKNLYVYKAQKGGRKSISGVQKAFSKAELHNALTKMGYKVHYIRKKLFDFRFRVPSKDLVLFMRISADLLREKFPYSEILSLIGNDTSNRTLRETLSDVQKDLRAGNEGHAVFGKHVDAFGKFTAHMLAVASTSGNMADIYESAARFLEREAEFKSNLRTILFMPAIVMLAMVASLVFYVMYIFPKVTDLLTKYEIAIPPMTQATINLSHFLQNHYLVILALIVVPVLLFVKWARTEKGRIAIGRTLIRLPVIGSILHRSSIEIFARVFSALYTASGENITAIRIPAESCRNYYIEKQITELVIPKMLKEGKSFVECLIRTNCFTLTAVRRLKSGEESGTLRASASQLANYYEKESKHKMTRLVESINLVIAMLITVLIIGLTLVSSEIGFVSPPSPLFR